MKWFGTNWGAPACRAGEKVATPSGSPCFQCGRSIKDFSRGFVIPHYEKVGAPVELRPHHLSCFLRSLGIEGRHSYYGG